METLAELREKLQGNKRRAKQWFWGHTALLHTPSLYATYAVLPLKIPVTANQLTLLSVLAGIAGSLLLFSPLFWVKIAGLFCIYWYQVFDSMDGEIARYTNVSSLKGIFLDDIGHLLVPPLFMIGITIGVFATTPLPSLLVLSLGVLGAISWSVIKGIGKEPYHLLAKHYLPHPEKYSIPEYQSLLETESKKAPTAKKSLLRQILAVRFQIRQFFIAFVWILASVIIDHIYFVEEVGYITSAWFVIFYCSFLILHLLEESIKGIRDTEVLVARYKNKIN